MQVMLNIPLNEPLSLPIAYHHIQQSFLYRLMGDDGNSQLHDGGYSYDKRKYKLFTFGPFDGKYSVHGSEITFIYEIKMEFRCVDDIEGERIIKNLNEYGLTIQNHRYDNVRASIGRESVKGSDLLIKMLSPITVRKTEEGTNRSRYYNPNEDGFGQAVIENFYRKYTAYTGIEEIKDIDFSAVDVRPDDKYLTRYKGYIIEGYKGVYRLKGSAEALNFLYNCGLGSRNSQGFGMFEIIRQ